jgi:hypothetical protein
MSKINWKIYSGYYVTDLTDSVLDFTLSWGRETFVSPYQGRIATITIRNNNQQANNFSINQSITIGADYGTGTLIDSFNGFVLTRDFYDSPGNGNDSTCVVTCVDPFYLAGTQQATTSFVDPNDCLHELGNKVTNTTQPLIIDGFTNAAFDTSTSVTGNIQSQIQQILLADHGIMKSFAGGSFDYTAPSLFGDLIQTDPTQVVSFVRTPSNDVIAYESITRSEAASEATWFNNATVTGFSTSATKSNGSTAQYGVKSFTTTSTQTNSVNSSAEWFANNFISPNRLSLDLTFTDVAQKATSLNNGVLRFLNNYVYYGGYFSDVTWTVPGGSVVTQTFWPEKISIHATTQMTRFTVGFTAINTYQSFILNSSTFGILDTSRLGVGPTV